MQAGVVRRPGPYPLPPARLSETASGQRTSRTIPVLVSEAEYQRLRGAREAASREPIDRRLAELLDGCD